MSARTKGGDWEPIAKQYFPHKSKTACRKRHERLMAQRNVTGWDVATQRRLAVEYTAMRESMWTTLAEVMGPEYRWADIEAKVSILPGKG